MVQKILKQSLLLFVMVQGVSYADTASEGFRAGFQLGYGMLDNTLTTTTPPIAPATTGTTDISHVGGRGGVLGLNFDYMMMLGHSDTLLGGEVSLNMLSTKGRKAIIAPINFFGLGNAATIDLSTSIIQKRSFDFTIKYGYLYRDAALSYVKVGPCITHWETRTVSRSANAVGSLTKNFMGLILGLGAEFPTGERFSWGFEYAYRRFSNMSYLLKRSAPPPLQNISAAVASSSFMVRFNYKMSNVDFVTSGPNEKKRKRRRLS